MRIMNKHAKGSGLKYNVVQFKATPSFSTSCDQKKQALTPRARKTKSPERPETPSHQSPIDPQAMTDGILQMFHGWSRREVKDMLRGTYSPDQIAEVLEILGKKEPGTPKRNHSRKPSGGSRE
eukprot:TRINITY_DN18022_c0_g1_i1.p2 TRINITY_DN18022_c0_g1~~TRINITY_DN18022_c0_g1_i1.p2  ORF type:complete len:123 (+),score=19.47 TRINITY_DN18022_c0_g1_i1:931-1299(+)